MENLMISSKNKVKLLNFEYAQFFNLNSKFKKNLAKTKAFENLFEEDKNFIINKKKDIFDIGSMTYFLVTGKKIDFYIEKKKESYQEFINSLFFPEWIDLSLVKLIKICLNSDINDRPSARILINNDFFKNERHLVFKNQYQKIYLNLVDIENSITNVVDWHFLISPKLRR